MMADWILIRKEAACKRFVDDDAAGRRIGVPEPPARSERNTERCEIAGSKPAGLAHRVVAALENAAFEAEAGRESAVVGRAEAQGRRIDGSGVFYAGDCADCGQELIG